MQDQQALVGNDRVQVKLSAFLAEIETSIIAWDSYLQAQMAGAQKAQHETTLAAIWFIIGLVTTPLLFGFIIILVTPFQFAFKNSARSTYDKNAAQARQVIEQKRMVMVTARNAVVQGGESALAQLIASLNVSPSPASSTQPTLQKPNALTFVLLGVMSILFVLLAAVAAFIVWVLPQMIH